MNSVAIIVLTAIVTLTSYICGFVMGYEYCEKETKDGYFRGSRNGKETWGNGNASESSREDS